MMIAALIDSAFAAKASVRDCRKLLVRQDGTTATIIVVVFIVFDRWSLLRCSMVAECRVECMVTRCALVEVGPYLLVLSLTLPSLVTWLTISVVRSALVLMLLGISEELELVEGKIRYCLMY
jgi:hypothetical protein